MKFRTLLITAALLLPPAASAGVGINAGSNAAGGIFYGGGIGASFGDVEYIDIAPMVGMHLSDNVSAGVSFLYRHVNDSRGPKTLKTNDYGSTIFTRYHIGPSLFLEADYEYLDHEFYRPDLTKGRKQFNSVLAGGGITSSLGGRASTYLSVLYNFSWDQTDSPYADPWTVRFGVGIGF
jgi:outer membrane protein assembly factor BamA